MRKNENGLPIKEIDLKLISDEVISRAVLNQETAIEYGCLMEAGTIFPPIEVFEKGDGTYIIGDGRTRYHAANLCNKITINCVVHPKTSTKEILLFALKCNAASGERSGFADARHTIMMLVELGCSQRYIESEMPFPKELAHRLWLDALQRITQKKCAAAVKSMRNNFNLSTADAARLHDISLDALIKYQKRHDAKVIEKDAKAVVWSIKKRGKSFNSFQAATLKTCMNKYMEGEMDSELVRSILMAFEEESAKTRKNLTNWQNRFSKIDGPMATQARLHSIVKTEVGYVMKPE